MSVPDQVSLFLYSSDILNRLNVKCCLRLNEWIILNLLTQSAQYGGRHTVTLMTGDGVGPELLGHVQEVFRFVPFKRLKVVANES